MALPYADREQAGKELGRLLAERDLRDPIVLAVPRGGISVAAPVARVLGADLDVIVVRKLGAPNNPELGIGAVGGWGEPWLDERLVTMLRVTSPFLEAEIAKQRAEALRRIATYRQTDEPLDVSGRDVIVVDDGIATGGTVTAAANLLRAQGPNRLILAVPVAPREALERLRQVYDEVVAAHVPRPYYAVGQWYKDFHQVSDDEVRSLLAKG
ncbi:MAG: phosphoribosyltransferase family protein [Actinomycetota bacterium]